MLPNRRNFAKSGHTESYANTSTYTLVHIGYTYISLSFHIKMKCSEVILLNA